MAHPEIGYLPDRRPERKSSVDPDIAMMRSLMGFTTPEPLIDLLKEHDNSPIVNDAVLDADTFYGNETRRYSHTAALVFPLRLAIPTPSEGRVSSEITTVRLLHQVSKLEEFDISAYGEAVRIGVEALNRRSDETYEQFMHRIRQTDAEHPELCIAVTQAKGMILNALDPVGLPVDTIRMPGTRIGIGAQLEKYERHLPHLLDKTHPWYKKVKSAVEVGKNALLDKDLFIKT